MLGLDDTNIWGFLAVPVGVLICFGPGLLLWIKQEYFTAPDEDHDAHL